MTTVKTLIAHTVAFLLVFLLLFVGCKVYYKKINGFDALGVLLLASAVSELYLGQLPTCFPRTSGVLRIKRHVFLQILCYNK